MSLQIVHPCGEKGVCLCVCVWWVERGRRRSWVLYFNGLWRNLPVRLELRGGGACGVWDSRQRKTHWHWITGARGEADSWRASLFTSPNTGHPGSSTPGLLCFFFFLFFLPSTLPSPRPLLWFWKTLSEQGLVCVFVSCMDSSVSWEMFVSEQPLPYVAPGVCGSVWVLVC